MKKLGFIFAALVAVVFASCTNGTPQANMQNNVDSLSYAFGVTQTMGLKDYLVQRMGVDTAYIDEFVKGLNESVNNSDDKKKNAYYAGLQIGQQVSQQMLKGINYELFGEDSTKTISLNNFIAGFIAGTTEKGALMAFDSADAYVRTMAPIIKKAQMEEAYGENKKECEAYMAEVAKKEGIQSLDGGVYYEVLEEGKGAIPTSTDRVKVHYEGKLINDTIFDSSYKREEPASFRCDQVIPGWTTALTHMPVGSKWKVYIPQDQAYAEREAGQIPPFSCLIFTIELISIEEEK